MSQVAFIVTLDLDPSEASISQASEELEQILSEEGFEVSSVHPWQRATISEPQALPLS